MGQLLEICKRMSSLSKEIIEAALKAIPGTAGKTSAIVVRGGWVALALDTQGSAPETMEDLRLQCEQAVWKIPGVQKVSVTLTAQHEPPSEHPRTGAQWNRTPLEGVRRIIAIASGKGGVGKSTMTVGLARALRAQGKNAGILDADIYGPSIPLMMGLSGKPSVEDGKMIPLEKDGIRCMSIGFLAEEGALVWRGPMLTKALHQMLRLTDWRGIDTLLIDMPPGTGDVHLSIAQQAPLDGAIIVTTPQEVAVIDARKSLQMFQKVQVPIWGVIENMSAYTDPATGAKTAFFGEGGGKRLAEEFSAPFLGEVPLNPEIQTGLRKLSTYLNSLNTF